MTPLLYCHLAICVIQEVEGFLCLLLSKGNVQLCFTSSTFYFWSILDTGTDIYQSPLWVILSHWLRKRRWVCFFLISNTFIVIVLEILIVWQSMSSSAECWWRREKQEKSKAKNVRELRDFKTVVFSSHDLLVYFSCSWNCSLRYLKAKRTNYCEN